VARTRYIKPAFFQNDKLAELSPWHRLLFAGLWTLADSSGRLEDRPKRIKGQLFPFDDVDIDALLSELAAGADPFVIRYQVAGIAYISVPKFLAHQRPHGKEPASVIPPPETSKTGAKKQSRGKVSASPTKSASSPTLMGNGEWGTLEPLMGNENGEGTIAPSGAGPGDSPDALMSAWNHLTNAPIPQCREVTKARRLHAKARLSERNITEWHQVISRIQDSGFCRGENDRGWVASFDWLLKPDTAVKVLEGKYDDRAKHHSGGKETIGERAIRAHNEFTAGLQAGEPKPIRVVGPSRPQRQIAAGE
jgi:hypothetical protein